MSVNYADQPAHSCAASRITLKEAETLLEVTLELNAVRQLGGNPAPVLYTPGGEHSPDFYYFVVHDGGPAGRASADGGLVGYFAVQQDTGKVFDISVVPKSLDDEPGPKALLLNLRRQHCVTDEVLEKWHDSEP